MPDGQVVFEITGDQRPIDKVLGDTTEAIERESKKWDNAVDGSTKDMGNSFTAMLSGIGGALAAAKIGERLLAFGQEAISFASSLREVQNVVDVTFGDNANQIETWAKKAQSQFGLTETQAKQFTSTLGAMMKSAGLAGPEIVGMSTDLAGLAADMASFYNMDFETAFQKIRSGISGETEPLKQLGINMSVANLEAYAMTQGITKAFDKMSQSEQTMLRYQYLMSATADALGDFARTADGYANSQRRIETALSSIKASAGTMLLDFVEPLTTGLAEVMEKLTAAPEKTVLDQIADIDTKASEKIAEIDDASIKANDLINILQTIEQTQLTNTSVTSWLEGLNSKLGGLDRAIASAKTGDYQGTIKGIADAMALKTGTSPNKWNTLLTAISEKLPAASEAAGNDGDKTKAFLSAAAEAAGELGGEYPGMWATFMATLGSDDTAKALSYMANGQAAANAMKSIGVDAKGLDGSEKDKWAGFLGVLETVNPTKGLFGSDSLTASNNINALSTALSSNDPAVKKQAWEDMLGVLTNNIDGVAELAKKSPEDTKKWLEGLAKSAAEIDPNDPAAWDSLFTTLITGLPGLSETSIGWTYLNNLKALATNSNMLDASSGNNWKTLLTTLNNTDVTRGIFGTNASDRITSLTEALTSSDPNAKKAAWDEILGVLSENADGVSKLLGTNKQETSAWLSSLAASADLLDPNDSASWNALFTALVNGLTGLDGKSLGADFLTNMKTVAENSNLLNSSSPTNWTNLLDALNKANVTGGIFSGDAASKITAMSEALSSSDPTIKQEAWSSMLSTLTDNADKISEITGKSTEDLAAWFADLNNRVPEAGDDITAWNTLFTELVNGIGGLEGAGFGEDFLNGFSTVAEDANKLTTTSAANWAKFLTKLNNAKDIKGIFGDAGTAAAGIEQLASALTSNDVSSRADAWKTLLSALSDNAGGLSTLTGESVKDTSDWLKGLATAANELDAGDTEGWNQLFTVLQEGLPGLEGDDSTGAAFFAALAAGFAGLSSESMDAEAALRALGVDTSNVEDKQSLWLATCNELVRTIPSLADVINTETGEIKGGTEALREHVEEWKNMQEAQILWEAHYEKMRALAETSNIAALQLDVLSAQQALKRLHGELDEIVQAGIDAEREAKAGAINGIIYWTDEQREAVDEASDASDQLRQAEERLAEAERKLKATRDANAEAEQQLADEDAALTEKYGDNAKAAAEAAEASKNVAEATEEVTASQKEAEAAIKGATAALEEVDKYYNNTLDGIKKTLQGLAGSFEMVETPAEKAKKKMEELSAELEKAKTDAERNKIRLQFEGAGEAIQSIDKMNAALQKRISFINKYEEMMKIAKERGVSDTVLAALADGSAESYDYLTALTQGPFTEETKKKIEDLNNSYDTLEKKEEELSQSLTDQTLTVDDAFQSLVDSATEAVNNLNLGSEAKTAMEQTIQGMADGIAAKIPAVQTQVDALKTTLDKLGQTGQFSFTGGRLVFGSGGVGLFAPKVGGEADPDHLAIGMDYVPYDNYLAALHEGESVLTAEEAKIWRDFKYGAVGSRNTLDYDALGATMRENIHGGGNVYLDGQTVGRVISAAQANSYRAMERSGFQK